jgi:hypothetical protein
VTESDATGSLCHEIRNEVLIDAPTRGRARGGRYAMEDLTYERVLVLTGVGL